MPPALHYITFKNNLTIQFLVCSASTAVKRNGRSGFSDGQDRHGRRLPFDFSFDSFYSGRKQDLQDAVALESGTVRILHHSQ